MGMVGYYHEGLRRGRTSPLAAATLSAILLSMTEGKKKLPRRFTLKTGEPFAFAGLWDVWTGEKQKLVTCCLITTVANELEQPVHDRMPVILPPESYGEWLDPGTPEERLTALLKPYPPEAMQVTEVGTAVNSPRNDGPECLEAA